MQQNQESMQQCQNCHKKIPQEKLQTHFSYCRRNIKKCPECPQYYDIHYQDQHAEEFHCDLCAVCQLRVPWAELEGHRRKCRNVGKVCLYCENTVAIDGFWEHQVMCGARTVRCEICRKYVACRDIQVHEAICTDIPQQHNNKMDPQMGTKRKIWNQTPRSNAVNLLSRAPLKKPVPRSKPANEPINLQQELQKKKRKKQKQKQIQIKDDSAQLGNDQKKGGSKGQKGQKGQKGEGQRSIGDVIGVTSRYRVRHEKEKIKELDLNSNSSDKEKQKLKEKQKKQQKHQNPQQFPQPSKPTSPPKQPQPPPKQKQPRNSTKSKQIIELDSTSQ